MGVICSMYFYGDEKPEVAFEDPQPIIPTSLRGCESFQCKGILSFIYDSTRYSLPHDGLSSQGLLSVADKMETWLENCDPEDYPSWALPPEEVLDLIRVFRAYGEKGYQLILI